MQASKAVVTDMASQVTVDMLPWLRSWGWVIFTDQPCLKMTVTGIIVARQGDRTWNADCIRAEQYESFIQDIGWLH